MQKLLFISQNLIRKTCLSLSHKKSFFYSFSLVLFTCFNVAAQEHVKSKGDRSERVTSATVSTGASSLSNYELKELEMEINNLLQQVRLQLSDATNKQWLHENLEKSIRQKSEQVCPNIPVLLLMFSNEPFVCAPNMDKQELLYAIEFLNVSINGMLTK